MSFNTNWDVNKYREEYESEDQWRLRKAFMLKWKNDYSEERLVCLARVFVNIEFMGCRYPPEVMQEVARLAWDIATEYRNSRKNKLQRTFVLASDAAVDRIRGTKREGGPIVITSPKKCRRIDFVPQNKDTSGPFNNDDNKKDKITFEKSENQNESLKQQCESETNSSLDKMSLSLDRCEPQTISSLDKTNLSLDNQLQIKESHITYTTDSDSIGKKKNTYNMFLKDSKSFYLCQMSEVECLNPRQFNEKMFDTKFGRFVLIIRPWNDIAANITNSCIGCKLLAIQRYEHRVFTITVNGKVLARAEGSSKQVAKEAANKIAWDYLRHNTVSLLLKEQFVPQNDTRISMNDMSSKNDFGTPVEGTVALKMMKLMGWKGGGLGADSQGIAEPIKPNFQMVNRAGLGHAGGGMNALRRAGLALMRRRSEALDADLVFTSEFTSEERAVLHNCALQCGLVSKSYGKKGSDRFLVVTNKVEPFSLVRAVTQQGGDTPKYQVFIPASLAHHTKNPR